VQSFYQDRLGTNIGKTQNRDRFFSGTRAGCDSGCSGVYKGFGMQAVAEGLITEKEVNASVRRLLRPHFELGLFDPIEGQPYVHLGWEHVATPDHQQLALEAARQSIVLLQNPGGASPVLPLKPGNTMLVAGPNYAATTVMLGKKPPLLRHLIPKTIN